MSIHHRHTSRRRPAVPRRAPLHEPPLDLSEALARAERAFATGQVTAFEGPPPEVQREMAQAERAWQRLAAQGREVHFGTGADGRVSVELTDMAGRPVQPIGPVGLFRLLERAGYL
jgi:hypothetical protein